MQGAGLPGQQGSLAAELSRGGNLSSQLQGALQVSGLI